MTKLSINDYKQILKFYHKDIPKSNQLLQLEAEKILSTKLCRCIKKIKTNNESKSIGICTKTVINNKGFKRGKFSCKNQPKIKLYKTTKNNRKTKKNN